jgi:hypothetical protein
MKEKIEEKETKIIGWYNNSSDHFFCFKCFTKMNELNKEKYEAVEAKSLENDVYTCDKCGKIFDERIVSFDIKKIITKIILWIGFILSSIPTIGFLIMLITKHEDLKKLSLFAILFWVFLFCFFSKKLGLFGLSEKLTYFKNLIRKPNKQDKQES